MRSWSDWLNGKFGDDKKNERTPEYYEDTHRDGVYVGGRSGQPSPGSPETFSAPPPPASPESVKSAFVMPRQFQNVMVYDPKSPEDVQRLIDFLKGREPAIINLTATSPDVAQRVLDFSSGAIYALGGSIARIAKDLDIFLLSPEGVEINSSETLKE